MSRNYTNKHLIQIITDDHEKPPILLEDFQHWLLERGHNPKQFPDADACASAWRLSRQYLFSLNERGSL